MAYHVVFVCVGNRARSVFAQFFFSKMLAEKDANLVGKVKPLSAGFVPQKLKDQLSKANIAFPEPFFNREMAGITRKALVGRGIAVPDEWKSKELTSDMVKGSDLIVTVLPDQKEELIGLFPETRDRIFTIKELAEWDDDGCLIFEDYERPPLDDAYWHFVDEDTSYASKIVSAMEEGLIRAYPRLLQEIGVEISSDNRE